MRVDLEDDGLLEVLSEAVLSIAALRDVVLLGKAVLEQVVLIVVMMFDSAPEVVDDVVAL